MDRLREFMEAREEDGRVCKSNIVFTYKNVRPFPSLRQFNTPYMTQCATDVSLVHSDGGKSFGGLIDADFV
jgi:hypothetical protein